MKRKTWFLVLMLALTSLAGVASAQQYPQQYPPQVQPAAPRYRVDLVGVTQRVAQQAAYEFPQSRFARSAQRLAQEATLVQGNNPAAIAQFEQSYQRTRRMLFGERGVMPSDALLDAWEQVVVAYAPYRRVNPGPFPQPQPQPQPVGFYQFDGRFEETPVRFSGRTLEELDRNCLQFTASIDTRMVDDVYIGAQHVRNGPSYWDAQALCSIVVLNASTAQSYAPVHTNGVIEGVPFALSGTVDVVRRAIEMHVPRLARQMQIDDLTINGQPYRNGPSFWATQQIVAMITSQLPMVGFR